MIKIKRGSKLKIEHNKILFWVIIILILLLVVLVYFAVQENKEINNKTNEENMSREIIMCDIESDCVPSSCCHAESCVSKKNAPDCELLFCSQVCQGPLDCNAGYCGCVNNKCEVINNEL